MHKTIELFRIPTALFKLFDFKTVFKKEFFRLFFWIHSEKHSNMSCCITKA